MSEPTRFACVTAAALVLSAAGTAVGQRGATVQGDALSGQGRFLRGMAWYDLETAQAGAIEADAVFAWNRARAGRPTSDTSSGNRARSGRRPEGPDQ